MCGITRVQDALAAARAGADAVGLVFYPNSPRSVSNAQAQEIIRALPPFITTVGLFVNATRQDVVSILGGVSLDMLQFHGDEEPNYCDFFQKPYLKAIRLQPNLNIAKTIDLYPNASGILLDSFVPGVPGGTGICFDWSQIPRHIGKPLVLAGGLHVDNIQEAIRITQPYAVDVSGGVEDAPGIKNAYKIKAFIERARGFSWLY